MNTTTNTNKTSEVLNSILLEGRSPEFTTMFSEILLNDLIRFEDETAQEEKMLLQKDAVKGDSVDLFNAEREKVLSLRLQGRNDIYIKKVRKAIMRIGDGTFGCCEDCSADIIEKRLLARPTATLCIACKEEEENIDNQTLDKNRTSSKLKSTDNILKFKSLEGATKAIENGFTDIA
jgi:DnaK suppressor protein